MAARRHAGAPGGPAFDDAGLDPGGGFVVRSTMTSLASFLSRPDGDFVVAPSAIAAKPTQYSQLLRRLPAALRSDNSNKRY
jgi:hypothetical protein